MTQGVDLLEARLEIFRHGAGALIAKHFEMLAGNLVDEEAALDQFGPAHVGVYECRNDFIAAEFDHISRSRLNLVGIARC